MKKMILFLLLVLPILLNAQHVTEIGDQSKLATFPGGYNSFYGIFIKKKYKTTSFPIPPNKFGDKVMLAFII